MISMDCTLRQLVPDYVTENAIYSLSLQLMIQKRNVI